MKRFAFLILFYCFVLNPGKVLAQTPSELTRRLIEQISQSKSLAPAAEKLDWSGAYERMDPAMKNQMAINSAEDLKKQQLEAYNNVGNKVADSIERALAKADESKAQVLQAMSERMKASLQEQKERAAQDFQETSYVVGQEVIDGDNATVEILKTRGDKTTKTSVAYVKSGGSWKLKSAAPLSPTASDGTQAENDKLLGPSISSPNAVVRY